MNQLNILGYRGSYLSLLFESLTVQNFDGNIKILINEEEKKALAPFETNIPYEEHFITDIHEAPSGEYIFCSNKPSTKKFLFEFYKQLWKIRKNDFFNLIHPSSVIASTIRSERGIQVEPLSVISPYTKVGFGVNIGRNCSIGHHNIINDFSSVHLGSNIAGHVEIGEGTTIGPGTTVFSQVKIGKNTIIGGGSVVTKNIPDNVLAFGNPCKIIKKLS